jgi:hypothetical protein
MIEFIQNKRHALFIGLTVISFLGACTIYRSVGRKEFERNAPTSIAARSISPLSKDDQTKVNSVQGLDRIDCQLALSSPPKEAQIVSKAGAYQLISLTEENGAHAVIWRAYKDSVVLCWTEWSQWSESWVRDWLKNRSKEGITP